MVIVLALFNLVRSFKNSKMCDRGNERGGYEKASLVANDVTGQNGDDSGANYEPIVSETREANYRKREDLSQEMQPLPNDVTQDLNPFKGSTAHDKTTSQ